MCGSASVECKTILILNCDAQVYLVMYGTMPNCDWLESDVYGWVNIDAL